MREGNILGWWLDWLSDFFVSEDIKKDYQEAKITREDKFEMVDWFWFKPLGHCVVCMNVWMSLFISLIFLEVGFGS
jgi:hypothetical protein